MYPVTKANALSNDGGGSWSYQKAITIDNTSGGALSNYPVEVTLTTSTPGYTNMNSDGSDVRFTKSDTTTEIPYWIETWNNSGNSTIWVNVTGTNSIPTGESTIYIHYGNSSATSSSNGYNTFPYHFASFETGSDGWYGGVTRTTDYATDGSYSIKLKTSQYDALWNTTFPPTPYVLEMDVRLPGGSGNQANIQMQYGTRRAAVWAGNPTSGNWGRFCNASWADSGISVTSGSFVKVKFQVNTNNSYTAWENSTQLASCTSTYGSTNELFLFGYTGKDVYVDAIRLRKSASPEPTATISTGATYDGSDSVSLTEALKTDISILLSDTVSLTDGFGYDHTPGGETFGGSDTVSLTESLDIAVAILLSDSVSLTEGLTKSMTVSLSDTVSLNEGFSDYMAVTSISLDDSLSLDENIGTSVAEPCIGCRSGGNKRKRELLLQ
jgi:hypothetical protein